MNLSFSINELLLFQIALFAIFSPFAVIGPYSVLTDGFSRKIRSKIAFRVGLYSSIILILISWGGEAVLKFIGISIAALGAAGGLVLIFTSLPMIMQGESPRKKLGSGDDTDPEDDWATIVVSPLVFPLTIGAGSISLVVTQAGMVESVGDRLAITFCLILHGFFIFASYQLSVPLAGKLGGKGSAVITRVGGIILLSLAFIIFTNGLKVLLPGLA
jgi:multiple antibiotic resistance protein